MISPAPTMNPDFVSFHLFLCTFLICAYKKAWVEKLVLAEVKKFVNKNKTKMLQSALRRHFRK